MFFKIVAFGPEGSRRLATIADARRKLNGVALRTIAGENRDLLPRTRLYRPGKVILVGAGPGDPDLLTLRAVQRIRTADVIVYDRLIHDGVLALAKLSAEKIYMGKLPGHHARQDDIHALLVEKARKARLLIRLKGGDPFLFGRGGEEVEYLAEHGIPFEVVPGVSSCLSAPLSAGIAVTHRESSSSVVIVTGTTLKAMRIA